MHHLLAQLPIEERTVLKYFKPWTTFGVGVIFGMYAVPKLRSMAGK